MNVQRELHSNLILLHEIHTHLHYRRTGTVALYLLVHIQIVNV